MVTRAFEIAKNSNAAHQIKQAAGWMEKGMGGLEKLRKYNPTGDARAVLADVILDIRLAQNWLDQTGVTEVRLPSIDTVKLEPGGRQ